MEGVFSEYLAWFFLSVLKFVITPSTMIGVGKSPPETIMVVGLSASIGFVAFYFFGEMLFHRLDKMRKKPRKRFTRVNRLIVRVKMDYGLWGMGLISGVISVPLAGLITAKYFRRPATAIPSIVIAFILWTSLLTAVSWLIKTGIGHAI